MMLSGPSTNGCPEGSSCTAPGHTGTVAIDVASASCVVDIGNGVALVNRSPWRLDSGDTVNTCCNKADQTSSPQRSRSWPGTTRSTDRFCR